MASEAMKIEMEVETCCVCGLGGDGEELLTPEEHDAGAPPTHVPLRAMLLHLNNSKVVPDGRLCANCIRRTLEAYNFSTALSSRGVPPLSEKIRVLRRRLHELTQKIDVFIVVGSGAGADGAYSEDDVIMVERDALAAAARSDDLEQERARNARGDAVYQCTVCPLSFQRVSEYRAHMTSHPQDALHSCWTCGAQFSTRAAHAEHSAEHDDAHALACHLCDTTFQSQAELRRHEAACPATCPACGAACADRAALRAHVAALHARSQPAACPACFRVFPAPAPLAAHVLRHRRPRQFVCGYDGCILRFAARNDLLSHIRKCHGAPAGEAPGAPAAAAPVPCASCERTFGSTAAMKRHARVHRSLAQQEEGTDWMEGEGEEVEYLEVETLEELEERDGEHKPLLL